MLKYLSLLSIFFFAAAQGVLAQDFLGGLGPASQKTGQKTQQKTGGKTQAKTSDTPKVSLPDKPNKTDAQGRRQGPWAKKYPNGRYAYEAVFKDDRPVGKVKRYYDTGRLSMTFFFDAKDSCHVQTFHPNGKTESRGTMFNKKREGVWTLFNEQGAKVCTITYAADKKQGVERIFFEDGRVSEIFHWRAGLKEGPYVRLAGSGAKIVEAVYANDELHGRYRSWGKDGKLTNEGTYRFGVPVGKWHVRYPDEGNLELDIVYDSHGLVQNKAEVDSVATLRDQYRERQRGKFDDPEQYLNSPEEYVPFK